MTQVTQIKKSIMGTIEFTAKFKGSRKEQDYIIYPINSESTILTIQSDTRFGYVTISNGEVKLTTSHSNGANSISYQLDQGKGKIKEDVIDNLEELLEAIRKTSGSNVGSSIVKTDNSFAHTI